jgi:hypothetical protein
MTTIAYKHPYVAADTKMTIGGTFCGRVEKIVKCQDGCIAGAAGSAAFTDAFLRWAKAKGDGPAPTAKEGNNFLDRGVIFSPDGILEIHEPEGSFILTTKTYALGSGRDLAFGAMAAGAPAAQAIRIAIDLDAHTGGEITVLRFDED